VIDCQNSGRGFYFHSGEEANSVLAGFTIKRGAVSGDPAMGGGIYCSGSSPTIENCVIRNNRANGNSGSSERSGRHGYGGGICCTTGSSPTIVGCMVTGNAAVGGRGGNAEEPIPLGCPGMGGYAFGGGIYGSGLTIKECVINNNSALGGAGGYDLGDHSDDGAGGDGHGGGIYGSVTISNSIISGNAALAGVGGFGTAGEDGEAYGGGLNGGSIINNCLIIDNVADDRVDVSSYVRNAGGGVYGGAALANCTISGNVVVDNIGGVAGAVTIINCILWGNGDDLGGCSATYSCIEDGDAGEGNIHDNPRFVTGPLGDYYLSQVAAGQAVDSPCVDAGSDTAANLGMHIYTTRTDEVGDKGIVDMGYHHSISPDSPDIDGDGDIDFFDYAWLSLYLFFETSKQIPRGSVVVDGDLSDWPGTVEWIELDKIYWGSSDDVMDARFALQWDAATNKVYAVVVVNDTNHVFTDEYVNWDASDRIEVYSQGDAEDGVGWNEIYDLAQQYYVAPDTTGGSWASWAEGETLGTDAGLEYFVRVVGSFIIYEVGVRMFDNYGGFSGSETVLTDLHAGHVVGFDIVACSRWDTVNFGMLSENLMMGKYNDAGKFAKYILVDDIFSVDLDRNGANNYADLGILFENWPGCYATKATSPNPTNNAISVDPDVTLSWWPGGGALYHDVYFGTDADAVANAGHLSPEFMGTVSGAHFDPCGLGWVTMYYWRIDEVGSACMIQGEVWNFTTKTPTFDEPNFPLAGQWKFDEGAGSIAHDSAGNNDGTIYGATWTTGIINGALSFDGVDNYVDCGNDASLDPGSGPFALSAWIKTNVTDDSQMIVCNSSIVLDPDDLDYRNVWFGIGVYNVAYIYISDISLNETYVVGTTNIEDGNWYYIAAIRDENNLYLYVDGVCEGTPVDATGIGDVVGPASWTIGSYIEYLGSAASDFFNGKIDEVAIYK
jgi:hypothetical protein